MKATTYAEGPGYVMGVWVRAHRAGTLFVLDGDKVIHIYNFQGPGSLEIGPFVLRYDRSLRATFRTSFSRHAHIVPVEMHFDCASTTEAEEKLDRLLELVK